MCPIDGHCLQRRWRWHSHALPRIDNILCAGLRRHAGEREGRCGACAANETVHILQSGHQVLGK
jgi:hypothetical protein